MHLNTEIETSPMIIEKGTGLGGSLKIKKTTSKSKRQSNDNSPVKRDAQTEAKSTSMRFSGTGKFGSDDEEVPFD